MLITLCAFRTYILPLASFLLQLENLPANWSTTEHKICTTLFPGPRGWMTTHALGSLKELGFPLELVDAKTVGVASKCRVHRWEDIEAGGLLINRRHRALAAQIASTDQLVRKAAWKDWWGRSLLKNLFDAQRELAAVARRKGNTIDQVLLKTGEEETPKVEWQKDAQFSYVHVAPSRCSPTFAGSLTNGRCPPSLAIGSPGRSMCFEVYQMQCRRRFGPLPCAHSAVVGPPTIACRDRHRAFSGARTVKTAFPTTHVAPN